jgi:hypothetical protein
LHYPLELSFRYDDWGNRSSLLDDLGTRPKKRVRVDASRAADADAMWKTCCSLTSGRLGNPSELCTGSEHTTLHHVAC